jgi:hypothetical protein
MMNAESPECRAQNAAERTRSALRVPHFSSRVSRHCAFIGAAVLGSFATLASGCGYRTDGLFREDIQTVYVDMFTTKEFRRDLEFALTEAVKKRIAMDTPYRLASKEKADTILLGEVLEVRQAAFAPDYESRLPREKQLTLAVRLLWKDQRSGRVLVDQPVELQAVDYIPPLGETDQLAEERAINRMSERIVKKMYADW